ncbi:hypothetical protein N665_0098s0033 [Sinapis alba]|nr:hypothetical protein N665_0098s0033 [Sinapis alba]
MRKTSQLSFTIFTIFIILALVPVNKHGVCVKYECEVTCREKRGPKAIGICFGSKERKPMVCQCAIC